MTNETLPFSTRFWFAWVCLIRVFFDGTYAARVWKLDSVVSATGAGTLPEPSARPIAERKLEPGRKEEATEPSGGLPTEGKPPTAESARTEGDGERVAFPVSGAATGTEQQEVPKAEGAKEVPKAEGAESVAQPEPAPSKASGAAEPIRSITLEPAPEKPDEAAAATVALPVPPGAVATASARELEQDDGEGDKAVRLSSALQLLGLFQRDGRLIDFLEQDIADFSDADVGAAARVVHEGCRRALHAHAKIAPVRQEPENEPVEIADGFRPSEIKLSGDVRGSAPYRGTLRHRGWRVTSLELPTPLADHDPRIVAPAEVEL